MDSTSGPSNNVFPDKFFTGFLNKSFTNILKEGSNMKEGASVENKENDISTANYQLLYNLYVAHKENSNSADMWPLIGQNYNFLTNSLHTVDEIKKIWLRMPAMLKRKFMLDAFTVDHNEANKKTKKATNKKNATKEEKSKIIPILKKPLNSESQKEPYDFSTKNNSKKLKVSFNLLDENSTTVDKSTQTEFEANESELSRKESLLKISILEFKLKYMQMQYKKQFE